MYTNGLTDQQFLSIIAVESFDGRIVEAMLEHEFARDSEHVVLQTPMWTAERALEHGYSKRLYIDSPALSCEFWVSPETDDYDSTFTGIDMDSGEQLSINGWLFDIEALN